MATNGNVKDVKGTIQGLSNEKQDASSHAIDVSNLERKIAETAQDLTSRVEELELELHGTIGNQTEDILDQIMHHKTNFTNALTILESSLLQVAKSQTETLRDNVTSEILETVFEETSEIRDSLNSSAVEMASMKTSTIPLLKKVAKFAGRVTTDFQSLKTEMAELRGKLTAGGSLTHLKSRLDALAELLKASSALKPYYAPTSKRKTFADAHEICRLYGGHLPVFNTLQDQQMALDALEEASISFGHVWIGITDESEEGTFKSAVDGSDPPFFNWRVNQPDNYHDAEDCVEFGSTGKWNDVSCTFECHFICQITV